MSAQSDVDTNANVAKAFKILGINWHAVIGFVGILGTVVAFLYNMQSTSDNNAVQITELKAQMSNVSTEYHGITTHLDTIERSIGRLEGLVNRYGNK